MKKYVLSALVLAIAGAAFGQSLCDYRTPETSIEDLKVSLYYRHYDVPTAPGPEISSGRIYANYTHIYDSPDLGYSLTGSAEVELAGFSFAGIAGQGAATVRRYLAKGAPYFAFGGLESTWSSSFSHPGVEVRAGLGYGHFTDVTPMAKAIRIEERLLAMNAIPASLPGETLNSVAQIIGSSAEYEKLSDLVADVAKAIQDASGATLNAKALLAIEEIVKETGRSRYCGYAIQLGLGYQLVNPQDQNREFVITASADGALAPEPGSQLLVRASLSGPYDILDKHVLTITASYDYQLNSTTSFTAEYSLRQVKPAGQAPAGDQSASFQLSLNLGQAELSLQVTFSKTAEAPSWTQDIIISVGMDLL